MKVLIGIVLLAFTLSVQGANTNDRWKGAVEPAESSPSGNENQKWKGAVEPAAVAAGGPSVPALMHMFIVD